MTKPRQCRKSPHLALGSMALIVASVLGCSGNDGQTTAPSTGGSSASNTTAGGASSSSETSTPNGGSSDQSGNGGASSPSNGGASSPSNGGSSNPGNGGSSNSGNGGASNPGNGGSSNPGNGGAATGGSSQSGTATGGKAQGGAATGGVAQGGAATGGVSTSGTAGTTGTISATAQQFVDATNAVRAEVTQPANYSGTWAPLPNVTWSDTVAASAQAWADNLAANGCKLTHEQNTGYGENLAMGTNLTPQQAVKLWADEKSKYTYSPTYTQADFNGGSGHYTQLVWRKSVQIGCGVATCTGSKNVIISCRYSPPGNYMGQPVY